jgi:RNase P subunit RPR2
MKLCIKRIYCDNCHKLVRCREQEASGASQILCLKCGRPLRFLDGTTWKYAQKSAT